MVRTRGKALPPQPNSQTLVRRPLRLGEEVYNALYTQLMSLKILPGARISVDQLVREMGVSQTPIREALSRLEAQGLVTKTHLIGYSAANQLDEDHFKQLYDLRLLLEPFAAERAAVNMTDESMKELEKVAASMKVEEATETRLLYSRFAQQDSEFHDLIARGSGNELVQDTLARLHVHVHLFRLVFHRGAASGANEEHTLILKALRERAPERAREAMRSHIERSRDRFVEVFRG